MIKQCNGGWAAEIMKKRLLLLALVLLVISGLEAVALLSRPKVTLVRDGSSSAAVASSPKQEPSFFVSQEIAETQKPEVAVAIDLELVGTAIGNIKDPSAFIKDLKTGRQGIYKLGSRVQEAKVVKIAMGRVVLDVNGKEQVLTMSRKSTALAELTESTVSLITVLGDQMIVNKNRLLSESGRILKDLKQVKVSPYYDAKKVAGMRVEGVASDSIIAAAGIQDKDVVTMVNSQKIDSYQKALQVLNKARSQSEIKVSVLRGGEQQTLHYKFQ